MTVGPQAACSIPLRPGFDLRRLVEEGQVKGLREGEFMLSAAVPRPLRKGLFLLPAQHYCAIEYEGFRALGSQ